MKLGDADYRRFARMQRARHTVCSACTSCAPATMESTPWCGIAAWQPWPRTVISKAQVPAITGPGITHLADRNARPVVQAEHRLDREFFEQAILDHHRSTAFRLLGRLEDEHGDAVEVRFFGDR
jgi:hypothetical protein